MKKIYCDMNPEYLVNVTCKLKPVRRYVSVINFQANVVKHVDELWVCVSFLIKLFSHLVTKSFRSVLKHTTNPR